MVGVFFLLSLSALGGLSMRSSQYAYVHLLVLTLAGCGQIAEVPSSTDPCSENWLQRVESSLSTGDEQGHGPDIGSQEWRATVEFRLGIRGSSALPARDSSEWCSYIDGVIF